MRLKIAINTAICLIAIGVLPSFLFGSVARADTLISTTAIPLSKNAVPATDLVDKSGRPVPVQQLQTYRSQGYDISTLEPATSSLWSPQPVALSNDLGINDGETVQYDSIPDLEQQREGNVRFNAVVQTPQGSKVMQFVQSRTVHDFLLRDAILRKLGYKLDPIKYLPKVKVVFRSSFEAENLENQLRRKGTGAISRYVVEGTPEQSTLTLQDVVAYPSEFRNYFLADGVVPDQIIMGRRVLSALSLPLSLVQLPESINLFDWQIGRIYNNALLLSNESTRQAPPYDNMFSTSYEDALWMARRISALTRQDFIDIVRAAQLPKEVSLLLVEKLVQRRNSLNELLGLNVSSLPVNTTLSAGPTLQNGKITKVYADNWPGYSARFALGDPDNPLSRSQQMLMLRSTLQSSALQSLVSSFNSKLLTFSNVNTILNKKASDRIFNDLQQLVTTGKTQSSTVGVDFAPIAQGNIILSRDVVTGSYLGSDNAVSAVDSVGASLTAGAQFQVYGLPTPVSLGLSATSAATRVYSHLTPVKGGLQAALKAPFRNMLVPILQHSRAKNFLDVLADMTPEKAQSAEGQAQLQKAINELKNNLQVGESFIITDTVGPSLAVRAGWTIAEAIGAYAKFSGQQFVVGRTNILRSDNDTIQIYRDTGSAFNLSFGVSLQAKVTVLAFDMSHFTGNLSTKFFSVPLAYDGTNLKNLQGLSKALSDGDLENLEDAQKPFLLKSALKADVTNLSLLIFRWRWQAQRDFITITAPTGEMRNYQRRVKGSRSGRNYEDFAIDLATALVRQGLGKELDLSRRGISDPGGTYGGRSQARIVGYEAQIDNYNQKKHGQPNDEVVSVSYRWKGWSADRKRLDSITASVNDKIGQTLISPTALQTTTHVKLYDMNFTYYIYEGAVPQMIRNISLLQKLLEANVSLNDNDISSALAQIRNLPNIENKGNFDDYASALMNVVNFLDKSLKFKDMLSVMGENNVFGLVRLNGFREGDEAGDQPYSSSSLGQVGSRHPYGPLTSMRLHLGISESELFANWFVESL